MADTDETKSKGTLSLSKPGKLELKKTVEAGQVRQSFSHGRSKAVTVEVRKKRTIGPSGDEPAPEIPTIAGDDPVAAAAPEEALVAVVESGDATPAERTRVANIPTLTDQEKARRAQVLENARREEEAAALLPKEPESDFVDVKAAVTGAEIEAEEARRVAEEEARRQADEEERAREELGKAAAEAGMAKLRALEKDGEAEEEAEAVSRRPGRRTRPTPPRPSGARRGEPRRRSGKLTIQSALDDTERTRSLASVKRARERQKLKEGPIEHQKIVRDVVVPESITVQELANRMAERQVEVVKSLMKMGVMATASQVIDADTAELVVAEFGHKLIRVSDADVEIGLGGGEDMAGDLQPRPPVVTVMGHVDHGKTSLLDALRDTDVAAHEAGAITQHIGASQITSAAGGKISFVDTPGHEAFTAMRARGTKVTDIVVLVVAADDGIMPQTVEAINHAKAAEVPIIVAINKIDRASANPQRIRTQLLEHEIVLEAMGGDVLDVEVSATERVNLDKLEEAILLQTEILDLKANPDRPAEGTIVEARVEQGRGPVATVLVQRGTLRNGEIFVAGPEWGRVRALTDDRGQKIDEASPSTPVEVIGLNGAPAAGDDFVVVENEARAREVSEFRSEKQRAAQTAVAPRGTLEQMFEAITAGEAKELALVVKTDVQGSAEAIVAALDKLPQDEVSIRILHQGIGGINESDVGLAGASNAVIIGFNVRANRQARDAAAAEGVDIRYYSVIYELIDAAKLLITGLMAPRITEHLLGNAEVREVFSVSKTGRVAGCYISEGMVRRGAKVRLLRDDVVIHEGSLSTLKRFKDDVREVQQNYECGMSFENYQDLKVGDVIECFEVEETAPEL